MTNDEDPTMIGTIEFFKVKKNIGMLQSGDKLYYFHSSNMRDKDLKNGEEVTFQARKSNIETSQSRLFAKNIRRK